MGVILLGSDPLVSLNASNEHRQALGELEASIEIEHSGSRPGGGWRASQRRLMG
jgi:hypothetical protein